MSKYLGWPLTAQHPDKRGMFESMTMKELKAYVAGCHAARDYDTYFTQACAELAKRGELCK